MQIKVLIVGVVKNGDSVLMRKKPAGSPPYDETWYIFGAELHPGNDPKEAIINQIKSQSGVDCKVLENYSWDTEIKHDLDGIEKQFVYLDLICEYTGGELIAGEGIEKVVWVPIKELGNYDIVPPSKVLFKKLGWL